MEGLIKKDLVEERGRSEGIGRPILYGTTDTFLKLFGFTTLKELPEIEDIEEVLAMERTEDFPPDMQVSMDEVHIDQSMLIGEMPGDSESASLTGEAPDDGEAPSNDE